MPYIEISSKIDLWFKSRDLDVQAVANQLLEQCIRDASAAEAREAELEKQNAAREKSKVERKGKGWEKVEEKQPVVELEPEPPKPKTPKTSKKKK